MGDEVRLSDERSVPDLLRGRLDGFTDDDVERLAEVVSDPVPEDWLGLGYAVQSLVGLVRRLVAQHATDERTIAELRAEAASLRETDSDYVRLVRAICGEPTPPVTIDRLVDAVGELHEHSRELSELRGLLDEQRIDTETLYRDGTLEHGSSPEWETDAETIKRLVDFWDEHSECCSKAIGPVVDLTNDTEIARLRARDEALRGVVEAGAQASEHLRCAVLATGQHLAPAARRALDDVAVQVARVRDMLRAALDATTDAAEITVAHEPCGPSDAERAAEGAAEECSRRDLLVADAAYRRAVRDVAEAFAADSDDISDLGSRIAVQAAARHLGSIADAVRSFDHPLSLGYAAVIVEVAQCDALRADRERRGGEPEYDPARVEREARASMALAREDEREPARGDLLTGPDFYRGDRVRFDDGPWRGQTAIITAAQIGTDGYGFYEVTLDDGSTGSFPHSGPHRPTARRIEPDRTEARGEEPPR